MCSLELKRFRNFGNQQDFLGNAFDDWKLSRKPKRVPERAFELISVFEDTEIFRVQCNKELRTENSDDNWQDVEMLVSVCGDQGH